MTFTRRSILGTLTAVAAAAQGQKRPRPKPWKPKLGVLARYSEANLEFVRQEGFQSLQLQGIDPGNDAEIEKAKAVIKQSGLYVSSLLETQNHIDPDDAKRARANDRFVKMIELTGKMGVPAIGTMSGTIPGKPLKQQVGEIVKVYTEKYFPVCEKYKVKIIWEPWAGGPNIATGPVGWEALFKAFNDSPHLGLQFDPSHLQWQMMDPVQAAKDFVGKIHDVHLKDTEVLWPVLHRVGIQPLDNTRWWRFRLPGFGSVDWRGLFTVLMEASFDGALNIEHEDELYYPLYEGTDFTGPGKASLKMCHQFLKQLIPA